LFCLLAALNANITSVYAVTAKTRP
jgi:hypothetical protein